MMVITLLMLIRLHTNSVWSVAAAADSVFGSYPISSFFSQRQGFIQRGCLVYMRPLSCAFTSKRFHQCNRNIYIYCSILQKMLRNFDHQILSFYLLPDLKLTLDLGRFRLRHLFFGTHCDNVKTANIMMTFRRHLKTYVFLLTYPP